MIGPTLEGMEQPQRLAKSLPQLLDHTAILSVLTCMAILTWCSYASADVVTLSDGRTFEGKVLVHDDEKVRIDTVVAGIRTTLTLPRGAVESIVEKPIPAGFYDPPQPEERVSDPKDLGQDKTPYLEVPIVGGLGKQVFADGVSRALSYAKRHRIHHVVFFIESEGGDLDEAIALYKTLKKHKRGLRYHALIRTCLGDALAVAVWCDSVRLLPDGKVGGLGLDLSEASDKISAEEEDVVRAQMVYDILADTAKTGRPAEIIRAMLEPSTSLCAWRGEEGKIHSDVRPPDGLPAESVIFEVKEGSPLQLTRDAAVALGMPPFKGGAEELGESLGISGWVKESDYGRKIMERTASRKRGVAERKQAAFEARVAKNIGRRESTERYIEHNMKEASESDPAQGSYQTYSNRWNWGWGWGGSYRENTWTADSRREWQIRTDSCIVYLKGAAKGLRTMKRLDKEAEELGLDPFYPKDEIDTMLGDIKVRLARLQAERDRRGE